MFWFILSCFIGAIVGSAAMGYVCRERYRAGYRQGYSDRSGVQPAVHWMCRYDPRTKAILTKEA